MPPLHQARGEKITVEVASKPPLNSRPQDLHRDRPALAVVDDDRFMDLRDGRRRHRGAELHEMIFELSAERGFHRTAGFVHSERFHPVLQQRKIALQLRSDDVAARCEKLAEFDVRGSKCRECRGNPLVLRDAALKGRGQNAHRQRRQPRHFQRQRFRPILRHEPDAVAREDNAGLREAQRVKNGSGHDVPALKENDGGRTARRSAQCRAGP